MQRPPKSFYIASRLENVAQVRQVRDALVAAGWTHTYDWTAHGSVQSEGVARIAEVAKAEVEGVIAAEAVIVLLPGGRGTHVELGIALAEYEAAPENIRDLLVPVCIYSADPDTDFNGTNGRTCAFYHHPHVQRFDDLDEMIGWLLSE